MRILIAVLVLAGVATAAEPISEKQPGKMTSVWATNTSIITSVNLPPGSYAVTATADLANSKDKESAIICALANGGMLGVDKSFGEGTIALSPSSQGKLSIEADVEVPADAKDFWVYFDCQGKEGMTTPLDLTNGVLTATPH